VHNQHCFGDEVQSLEHSVIGNWQYTAASVSWNLANSWPCLYGALIIVDLMIETLLDLWGRPQSLCCAVIILQVSLNRRALCHCLLVSLHTVLTATCFLLLSLTSVSLLDDPRYMQFLPCAIRIFMCWTKKLSSSLFKLTVWLQVCISSHVSFTVCQYCVSSAFTSSLLLPFSVFLSYTLMCPLVLLFSNMSSSFPWR